MGLAECLRLDFRRGAMSSLSLVPQRRPLKVDLLRHLLRNRRILWSCGSRFNGARCFLGRVSIYRNVTWDVCFFLDSLGWR